MTTMKRLATALVAALALSAVLTLSACAVTGQPARPGTAAIYAGGTITTEQVAAWGNAQNAMGYGYDPGAVLTLLLLRPALEKEAASEGIVFADDQVSSDAQLWMAANHATVVPPTPNMMDLVRMVGVVHSLLLSKPGAAAIQAELKLIEANAQVNPAYGDFTYAQSVVSVQALAKAQQDSTGKYANVSYLVFSDMSGFNVNAQRDWMVDAGLPSASPSPSPVPGPSPAAVAPSPSSSMQ